MHNVNSSLHTHLYLFLSHTYKTNKEGVEQMAELLFGTLDPSNFLFFEVGLSGLYEWIKEQAKIILFIILIGLLVVTIVKRAWVSAVGVLVGMALVGVFITNPEYITNLSSWLAEKLSLDKKS